MVYGLLYYFVYFIQVYIYICRESVNQLNDEKSVFLVPIYVVQQINLLTYIIIQVEDNIKGLNK